MAPIRNRCLPPSLEKLEFLTEKFLAAVLVRFIRIVHGRESLGDRAHLGTTCDRDLL